MKEKYLPIGTVCTLKGKNKKTMIVGFFSIEYNGNVTMYDYCGYDYPEGLLLNRKYSFNHNDIEKIDYLGFKNEEYEILNKNMLKQNAEKTLTLNNLKTQEILKNIKFDENGVVVFEQLDVEPHDNQLKSVEKSQLNNETLERESFIQTKKEEPSNVIESSNNSRNWNIFKSIKFDENGVVTEMEEYTPEELEQMQTNNINE